MLIQLHCATQGASIAYTFESGEAPHWLLYTKPMNLNPGETSLRAKAIRIGYRESNETQAAFTVEAEQLHAEATSKSARSAAPEASDA